MKKMSDFVQTFVLTDIAVASALLFAVWWGNR
jgi:hypothetical protein